MIREIFGLYASGRFCFRTLAEHLNRQDMKPPRGEEKANHNRPKAVIFTGDVLKDLIGNASYLGKVLVDGELIEGRHPALIDDTIWQACQEVKRRNVRRTSKAWTKHTYPLTPILLCARCGGPMHGEAAGRRGRLLRYYGCHASRCNRSAVNPSQPRCDARMLRGEVLEEAVQQELSRLVPSDQMHTALRGRLRAAGNQSGKPRNQSEAAIKRLAEHLMRARRLYEFGEYDWETFCARRDEIQEQQRQLSEAGSSESIDMEWCEAQLLDLVTAWEAADPGQALPAGRRHLRSAGG